MLDPKRNCWTDDEEDLEMDENSGMSDYGGRHKNYTPTKYFIKVIVMKKSGLQQDDEKKLRKELGFKMDDVRNYFQPSSSKSGGPSLSSSGGAANQLMTSNDKP